VTGYPFDPSDLAPDETADDFARLEASLFGDEPLSRLKRTEYVVPRTVDRYFDGTTERFDVTFEYVKTGGLSTVGLDEENARNLAQFIMDAFDTRDTAFTHVDPEPAVWDDVA
jgi:hypothetical protein